MPEESKSAEAAWRHEHAVELHAAEAKAAKCEDGLPLRVVYTSLEPCSLWSREAY